MPTSVYIDNIYVGEVEDPIDFVNKFREERRKGKIPNFINIAYDEEQKVIKINTSKGRLLRPLIVVKDGKPLLTDEHIEKLKNGELKWSDLEKMGIIEWVDPEEEENLYVALTPEEVTNEHTHLEISPLVIMSILTSLAPFSVHNQAARLNRGIRPMKQSHAIYAKNFWLRFDTDISIMYYPQEPIVRTFSHYLFKDYDVIGQNVIVAVMTHEGYNMEDAIILNKGSVDRGLFRSVYFRSYEVERVKYPSGLTDIIGKPEPDVMNYKGAEAYRLLDEDGIVRREAEVNGGDVLVGKISPPRFIGAGESTLISSIKFKDSSLTLPSEYKGIVDNIIITESQEGNLLIKIKVRDLRIPQLGDKFSVRHGQKGVIGMIVDESDMPWSSSGLRPDIIFSPFGIPSRRTVGLLLELLAGKVGALSGRYVDGTPWIGEKPEDLRRELLRLGFVEDGTETMYNPLTGEEFKVKIYIGSIYYMRLKYLAENKLHARARGPVTLLTKQPTEGKAREGGLRAGEMESEVLVAHGASSLLRERFSSDDSVILVCENCGALAVEDEQKKIVYCPVCGEKDKISKVKVSHAFSVLLKELISLGIWPKLKLSFKFEHE